MVLANLVGASVAGFIGAQTLAQAPTVAEDVVVWIIIMAVAIWCAICFLQGALAQARRWFR